MRVLFVDQLSKVTGHDTNMLVKKINSNGLEGEVAISNENIHLDEKVKSHIIFINVFNVNKVKKIINYIKSLNRLINLIKKGKFDVVNLQWFMLPWIENFVVKKIKKHCKVYITIHDVVPFNKRFGEMRALKKIYSLADGLFLLNNNACTEFEKYYNIQTKRYILSSAFCDKNEFEIVPQKDARDFLGIPNDKFVFLYYGSIRDSKGLDNLICAFSNVAKKFSNLYLVIAGAFSKVNPEYYYNLVKEKLNSNNSLVKFMFVPSSEEKYYFSSANVLCLPYKSGFQSGVAQIGLMYDLPLIVSNIGDLPSCVSNGKNGYVYNALKIDALEEVMEKIINSDLVAFSNYSKELSVTQFSLDEKAKKMVRIFLNEERGLDEK